jgi:large subunit ribosomal protein L10
MSVVGGVMGSSMLSEESVRSLASLPSLDVLRANLIGLLSQPASQVVRVIQTPPGNLARVISAHASHGEMTA